MDTLGSRSSSVATRSPMQSVHTDQSINEPQLIISGGVTSLGISVLSRDDYFVLLQNPGKATSPRRAPNWNGSAMMVAVIPVIAYLRQRYRSVRISS